MVSLCCGYFPLGKKQLQYPNGATMALRLYWRLKQYCQYKTTVHNMHARTHTEPLKIKNESYSVPNNKVKHNGCCTVITFCWEAILYCLSRKCTSMNKTRWKQLGVTLRLSNWKKKFSTLMSCRIQSHKLCFLCVIL